MSRNGSGTFQLASGNPVVTGTVISSTVHNNTMSDIASALTQSIAADGQTPVTANLPMNSKKITGLAAATTTGDALSYGQSGMGALSGTRLTASTGVDTGNSAQTGNILDWYEEGAWTPTVLSASGTFSGRFTRIGNRVFFDCYLNVTNWNGASSGSQVVVSGLPYSSAATYSTLVSGGFEGTNSPAPVGFVAAGASTISLRKATGAVFNVSDATVTWGTQLQGSYQVA
jgi:hypothetical protein